MWVCERYRCVLRLGAVFGAMGKDGAEFLGAQKKCPF